jgi:hypothetical protein
VKEANWVARGVDGSSLGQKDKHEHTGRDGGSMEMLAGAHERLAAVIERLVAAKKAE